MDSLHSTVIKLMSHLSLQGDTEYFDLCEKCPYILLLLIQVLSHDPF
jgi:hypothetical protein